MAAQVPSADHLSHPPPWALRRVPGLERDEPALRLERLGGGTVNVVYRVDSAVGRFVIRLDGPAWRRPGVDRARELALHRTATAGGIAPVIVAAEPQMQGLLITEFHEGRRWEANDYGNRAALRRLGERLYALHRLPAPAIEPFDPLQVARGYQRLMAPQQAVGLERSLQRLETLREQLKRSSAPLRVVHGDLWHGNVLEGARVWLLDWEYAQLTDPLMDIACLLAYYPRAARYRADLLAAAGFHPRPDTKVLMERVDIYRLLNWLWHLVRGETAQPPSGRPPSGRHRGLVTRQRRRQTSAP
jgi:thiamine kinase